MENKWRNNTIICVDDEESMRDTYQRVLSPEKNDFLLELIQMSKTKDNADDRTSSRENKYNLLLAHSGEAAVEMITKEMEIGHKVAAGFFDMRMPGGMDGFETIKKARQIDNDLICCVVTAYTDREVDDIRSLFTNDHQDELLYIKKPFTIDELDQAALNMISAWNNKRRLEDQVRAIEKQRIGLRRVLHAISTFSKIPPHSLEHLIPGLLFQLLGIVEGENGFSTLLPTKSWKKRLNCGVGKFEHYTDLVQTMDDMSEFKQAFQENRVVVENGRCSIPLINNKHKLGGMYIESNYSILSFLDKGVLEVFKNQVVNLLLNSIYHGELIEKEIETVTDPLTGLYNRRFISKRLNEELARSHRNKRPLAIVMIDIDDFKQINDKYGHEGGDRVLQIMANILRLTVRDYDLIVKNVNAIGKEEQFAIRYGGEEFCLVLPDTNDQDALVVAERVRKKIEQHVFQYREYKIRLTVSIGLYSEEIWSQNADPIEMLSNISRKADEALYQAKAMGKNRVVVYKDQRHIRLSQVQRK